MFNRLSSLGQIKLTIILNAVMYFNMIRLFFFNVLHTKKFPFEPEQAFVEYPVVSFLVEDDL